MNACVRSSGAQAHEERMRDARQGCDRRCCARLLRAIRVGANQHLRPRRLLLLLLRVAGLCSNRARLGRCWPRILLRHPPHILVAVARGHAGEPIFRLVAAATAAALRRCAFGLRARRRQPRSQYAHDQPRARSCAHRQSSEWKWFWPLRLWGSRARDECDSHLNPCPVRVQTRVPD